MEDGDDDFGDLYADVEVEAMNVTPQISQISDEIDKQDVDNDKACIRIDSEDEDDDDDDLDIVLNSDDDNREGFTIARNNSNSRSTELEDEDDDSLGAEVKVIGNSRSMYKYIRSQQAAFRSDLKGIGCMTAACLSRADNAYWQQMRPQSAQRFSLPRARNILDVNIDIFEQKPWKHPGADITDYFNFGFNEDSWKHYCNQVDEYRHRGPVSSGIPPSELDQSTEVDRSKGQAIQVEGSIFERQSSMDVRRQVDRDSDVIQITILDPEDTSVPEASHHGDDSYDDVTDHLSFSSASEDESVEVNHVDNHEIDQVRTKETIRNSEYSKESDLVAESSHEDKSPPNHRRRFYTYDRCRTELTRSVKPDYHKSEDLNKSDDKRGPDESRYRATRFDDSREHGDRIYHERCNNHDYENRAHKGFNLKTHGENDDIISRRTDVKRKTGEHRHHARRNNGFLPVSDTVHSPVRQRLHEFDSYNEENILYPKSKVFTDYYGERFRGYEDLDTERFQTNIDRAVFRSLEEGDYYAEDKLYFRNKSEIDDFYLEPEYYNDTDGENFRSFSYNDKKQEDVENTRWEFRNKRRSCNIFSEVDDLFFKRDKERSFKSCFPEKPHIDCKSQRYMTPKNSFYRRHGSYGEQYYEPCEREDYAIDIDDRVDMSRKNGHGQSEIQLKDEFMFKHEDVMFCAHRNSFLFEKVSRRKRFVYEPDLDHVEEWIDDPYVVDSHLVDGSRYFKELTNGQRENGCRIYRQKNEVFSGNKCVKTHGKSRKRLPLSSRKSHLLVGQVKSSEKHKKPEWVVLETGKNNKTARADETNSIGEGLDIEEGQIVTEEVQVGTMMAHVDKPVNQNEKSGFDSTRILEAMAKMEKRRVRFNEPITVARKGSDSSIKPTVVDSGKQERPVRKRRWGGK